MIRRDQRAPGSRRQRLGCELAAVDLVPGKADEQRAWTGLTGVDDGVLGTAGVRGCRDQARPRGLRDACGVPAPHVVTEAPLSSSPATATSSNGFMSARW